ncbi:thrombopoietin [Synchiropus splendidus]|uniref:thrombopoietin n=1 Tax=Synchiropus splendidus TaxID=270530 RepID=UPI00237E92CC|nr:thrombopoietin [Synchiropus splendidus]
MAYSTGLLFLIGVLSFHLPEFQARPTDFWCNYQVRKKLEERIEELSKNMVDCTGADTLPSPLLLPRVLVHAEEWTNKTLQQKRREVVSTLQAFQEGLEGGRTESFAPCQIHVLRKLTHHVTTHLLIVQQIQIEDDTEIPSESSTTEIHNSITAVLGQFLRLLRGKVERLAVDLQESICSHRRTTEAPDSGV